MPRAINGMKECSKCHEVKPVEEFRKNKGQTDGRRCRCKECESYTPKYKINFNPVPNHQIDRVKIWVANRDRQSAIASIRSQLKLTADELPSESIPEELIELKRRAILANRKIKSVCS